MEVARQSSTLPDTWVGVIDRVQETIGSALEELTLREKANESAFVKVDSKNQSPESFSQEHAAADRPKEWKIALERIRQSTARADAELQGSQEALQQWLVATQAMARNLEEWGKV
jgi:hypothetical protein